MERWRDEISMKRIIWYTHEIINPLRTSKNNGMQYCGKTILCMVRKYIFVTLQYPPFWYKHISDNRYPVIVKDYTSGSLRVLFFFLLSKYNLKRDYINQCFSLTCINRFWYCTTISFSKHPPVYPGSNMLNLSIHKWPDKFIVSSYKSIQRNFFTLFVLEYPYSVLSSLIHRWFQVWSCHLTSFHS